MEHRIPLEPLFGTCRPLIGMIHLPPLPGAPRWQGSMDAVLDRALADAEALRAAGFDALLVENFGDTPFHADAVPPETVAAMAVTLAGLRRACPLPIGVNVLRNDAAAGLALCAATGASFLRINVHTGAMLTDQGWIEGAAARTLRARHGLGLRSAILADVLVKHAVPPPGLELASAARDAWERGLADGLVVSGPATGSATPAERIRVVRAAAPDAPIIVGSGLDPGNAADLLAIADGAIVGSSVQRDGRAGSGVDPERARRLVAAARVSH